MSFVPAPDQIAAAQKLAAAAPVRAIGPAGAERLERVKRLRVMIVTPISSAPSVQYHVSMLAAVNAFNQLGVKHRCEYLVGSSNLPRARNALAARFLASDCDALVMIDDDMGFAPNAIFRLLASDHEFAAAAGRRKNPRPNGDASVWCVQFLPDTANALEPDEMGMIEVARVGAAFVKLDRAVLERLAAAHPDWKRDGPEDITPAERGVYHRFFAFDDDRDEEMGEDYLFCDRFRAVGGEIWIDPSVRLSHIGPADYGGALIEILSPTAAVSPIPLLAAYCPNPSRPP